MTTTRAPNTVRRLTPCYRPRPAMAAFFLISLWFVAAPVGAQITLGIRGGSSLARVSGVESSDVTIDWHTGINAGPAVSFSLSDRLGIQTGGFYVQKGVDLSAFVEDFAGEVGTALSQNYIEVPVMLTVNTDADRAVQFRFYAGPAVAYRSSCQYDYDLPDSVRAVFEEMGIADSGDCEDVAHLTGEGGPHTAPSWDFGMAGGLGVGIGLSDRLQLTLDGYFTQGLRSVDTSEVESTDRNQAVNLQAGLAYSIW